MNLLPLTQGKVAFVDDADFESVNQFKWHYHPTDNGGYACRKFYPKDEFGGRKNKRIFLHHAIMGRPDGVVIDHINRNGLDNRRENLRLCTRSQNIANRVFKQEKLRGTHKLRGQNIWTATICVDWQRKHLGRFKNELDAAKAYDEAALRYFGEFAILNFPEVNS